MKKYINNRLKHFTAVESGNGKYSIYKGQFFDSILDAELITGSSDWILQKEWNITAFSDNDWTWVVIDGIVKDGYGGKLETWGTDKVEYIQKIPHWQNMIYSVRNSAGVEFKLGDKTNKGFIKKFKIDDSSMICVCEGNFNAWDISNITLSPAVLFTTFDGKEICKNDFPVILVGPDFGIIGEIKYTDSKFVKERISKGYKYFSTREAAESYISQNKKKYSENDILEVIEGASWCKEAKDYLITKLNEK